MTLPRFLIAAVVGLLFAVPAAAQSPTSASSAPARAPLPPTHGAAITEGGRIFAVPDAEQTPDKALRYRVIFDIVREASSPDKTVGGLEKIARLLNLLADGDVAPAPGDIAGVAHGPATDLILNDTEYRARYGMPNPNAPLIAALLKKGVRLSVCGQAMTGRRIDRSMLLPGIIVDKAAILTLSNHQLRGWAVIPD